MLPLTPSQTVGPFFLVAVPTRGSETLVTGATPGPRVVVEGSVRDGAGDPIPDALLEIWQANAAGHCNHPDDPRSQGPDSTFDGFGRVSTDVAGCFAIETIKPGSRRQSISLWQLAFATWMGFEVGAWSGAGAFAVTFIGFGSAYTFSAFVEPLQRDFAASRGSVSLVFSLAGFLYFGLGVVSGPLADRWGARRLAVIGMLLTGAGLAIASFARSLGEGHVPHREL